MSLLPYILDDFYPPSCYRFGSGYHQPSEMLVCPAGNLPLESLSDVDNYLRSQLSHLDELEKESYIGEDGFQACLNVQHFQPNEISVTTENNSVVVHAKHEEKKDNHGYISREFTRRFVLPKGFKIEEVTSSLSSDGVLSIKCPPAPTIEGRNVRQVQIQHTGPAKRSIKSNKQKKDKKKPKA